jgi:hypothetical protein
MSLMTILSGGMSVSNCNDLLWCTCVCPHAIAAARLIAIYMILALYQGSCKMLTKAEQVSSQQVKLMTVHIVWFHQLQCYTLQHAACDWLQ